MKYKIHYKGLDNLAKKEKIINKIKNFFKNKYNLEQHSDTADDLTVFSWKEYQPGFGTNASEHALAIDWDKYTVYQVKNSEYEPFSNKELEFFDKLGFELDPLFADSLDQNIYDWMDQ